MSSSAIALPALDKEKNEFTEEAGTTRWYLYDLARETILEEPGEIVASIRSKPKTPRRCNTEEKTLLEIRQRIEKHIKNSLPEARGCPRRRQAAAALLDGAERGLSRCRPTTANASRASGASPSSSPTCATTSDWPIDSDDFEELTFDYTPEELGIDAKNAAKIQEIKRLRPLVPSQPWGIFFVKFEPKRLPVVALRRILGQVALKKRASANKPERQAWAADDLLFVSTYGEGGERRIAFAHFSKPQDGHDLPTLKVLGWDNLDTPLHLDAVARELSDHLTWPDDEDDPDAWRERWRSAFTLRHREVITTSKQLSERLAKLARAIRDRIRTALDIETESGPLTKLMKAFQTALVHDLDEAGFADMYAQTIAYGLLSARITDPERRTADDLASHMRTNPFLKELMETFLHVGGRRGKAGEPGIDFDELGVSEVVELLDDSNTKIEAVVRDFGDRNPQEDPVIHFYEHFLAVYDKKQKVSRGVFYTPRPVVSYIVRSVHELLRTEFGLTHGLADTTTWGEMAKRHKELKIPEGTSPAQAFVRILDPATGTGTFLVEVIDLIHKTMVEKWTAQGHGEKKIQALWKRLCPEPPAAAPARLRAADGPIRHRAPQDRAPAIRDRLPLRERRARAGVPDERARAAG